MRENRISHFLILGKKAGPSFWQLADYRFACLSWKKEVESFEMMVLDVFLSWRRFELRFYEGTLITPGFPYSND